MPLTVRFTDQTINGTTYNWDFGDGTQTTVRNPSHTYTEPGNYTVSLMVPGPDGKQSNASAIIRVYSLPEASFSASPQVVYVPDDKVHFINRSTDATKYYWEFGDGSTSEEKNPSYVYTDPGLYTVSLSVWNEHGCGADTTKYSFVEARRGGFIVFPNTFAPREYADGSNTIYELNAKFRPVYQDVVTFHLQIFNKWGQLIYETDDIDNGWDGRFDGKLAPQGVYVWTATGKFESGKEYSKSGQVLIIR